MKLFVLTTHCTSGQHCQTCRDLEGGKKWRAGVGKIFELPAPAEGMTAPEHFACPKSLPWGWKPVASLSIEERRQQFAAMRAGRVAKSCGKCGGKARRQVATIEQRRAELKAGGCCGGGKVVDTPSLTQ